MYYSAIKFNYQNRCRQTLELMREPLLRRHELSKTDLPMVGKLFVNIFWESYCKKESEYRGTRVG